MSTTELNRGWKKQKSELIHKFAILTENDLIFEEGEKEEMFKKLRIRLGKTKEELKKIIAAF
ncbi:MAG: general stress protein CsbD [Mariniphaga sp.]|nr:general stress protein CsbD [Mariniphaga sp.]